MPPDPILRPLRDDPAHAGILTDFDGTLAPIVADPAAARPLAGAVPLLHDLARSYGCVAVVSGRPASFLVEHLRLADSERLFAFGLYGLERAERDVVTVRPGAAEWRATVATVAAEAQAEAPPGVIVETKGLALTLHSRTAPGSREWAERWAADAAARTGLVVYAARMSAELRPPVGVDKGTVVAELTAGLAAVCFIGDDQGDLAAFAALDALRDASGVHAVKVGVRSSEVPAALLESADVLVDGPEGALALLASLRPD